MKNKIDRPIKCTCGGNIEYWENRLQTYCGDLTKSNAKRGNTPRLRAFSTPSGYGYGLRCTECDTYYDFHKWKEYGLLIKTNT